MVRNILERIGHMLPSMAEFQVYYDHSKLAKHPRRLFQYPPTNESQNRPHATVAGGISGLFRPFETSRASKAGIPISLY